MKNRFLLLACSALAVLAACNKQPSRTTPTAAKDPCAGQTLTFTADVKPIIDANCASSCHSAAKHAKGIDLSTYEKVKEAAARPNFLGSMRHESGFAPMPKNHAKLDEASIQKIACWTRNGMAE